MWRKFRGVSNSPRAGFPADRGSSGGKSDGGGASECDANTSLGSHRSERGPNRRLRRIEPANR